MRISDLKFEISGFGGGWRGLCRAAGGVSAVTRWGVMVIIDAARRELHAMLDLRS